MITSTLNNIPDKGKEIVGTVGVVYADIVAGANFIKDTFASIGDTLGGRIGSYEKSYAKMRASAVNELVKSAESGGANAVIGIQFQINSVGKNNSILQLSAHGTAVIVRDIE